MRRPNLPKGRPGVPRRHVRVVTAPTVSLPSPFTVVMPLMRMASLFGDYNSDPVASAERGRLIGMAQQQIEAVQRENAQAHYANGIILGPGPAQYF